MRKLIIASHSTLAKGLTETLDFLTGMGAHIDCLCAYVDENEDIDAQVEELLDTEDEVIILTDMMGGSVNQKFFQYAGEKVHVIAGMNLPLATSIALQLGNEELDLMQIIEESQQQIIYMNNQVAQVEVGDE